MDVGAIVSADEANRKSRLELIYQMVWREENFPFLICHPLNNCHRAISSMENGEWQMRNGKSSPVPGSPHSFSPQRHKCFFTE
jgi:hypothetical protein